MDQFGGFYSRILGKTISHDQKDLRPKHKLIIISEWAGVAFFEISLIECAACSLDV